MQRLPFDADNWHTDLYRVVHRVFCSAFFAVEYRNDSGSVVYHPFVSDLIAGTTVQESAGGKERM